MKKLEIKKTKPTCIISVLKVDTMKVGLFFSISNCFITKTSLANNWRNLALVGSFQYKKSSQPSFFERIEDTTICFSWTPFML